MTSPNGNITGYLIDEEVTINSSRVEIIFDKTLSWLKDKGAKIEKQAPSSYIKASHGSWFEMGGESEKSKKIFEFMFIQKENDVILRTVVYGPVITYYSIDEVKRNWLPIIETLWVALGVSQFPEVRNELFEPRRIIQDIEKGYRNMYLGIVAGSILFTGMLLFSIFFYDLHDYATFFIMIPFFLGYAGYSTVKTAKKKLIETSTGIEIPNVLTNKKLVTSTITVIVICSATLIYMVACQPTNQYSGYDFSFKYPLGFYIEEDERTTEQLGSLGIIKRDGKEAMLILWISNPLGQYPLGVINSIIEDYRTEDPNIVVNTMETMEKNGEIVQVKNFSFMKSGVKLNGVICSWLDSKQNRLYILGVLGEDDVDYLFKTLFDSFETQQH